jgi:hypothetical protein
MLQHCLSLFISDEIGKQMGTQCEWYLMGVAFDCTLGVLFSYYIHNLILSFLEGTNYFYKTGIYTTNEDHNFDETNLKIDYKIFFLQVFIWSIVVLLVN